MNRYRKNDKAVSPVIATILMVAITVVLAGVLVVYLQTLPQTGGNVETPLGIRVDKQANGDWTLFVTTGSKDNAGITLQVVTKSTGVPTVNVALTALVAADGIYHDNDAVADTKLNVGDTIELHCVANLGHATAGQQVQLLKNDNIIAGPRDLA
jgi:flagellin-like protein